MLKGEGFSYQGYVDIFDGGPTMTARTDHVRTIRDARESTVVAIDALPGREALVAVLVGGPHGRRRRHLPGGRDRIVGKGQRGYLVHVSLLPLKLRRS